jgi:D-cysteine desulfhydrase family pyridoxal phosphate-dependent enzyme
MKQPERIHLASLPTPVEPLPRLSEHLGGPNLFIKRDDLTGLAFGGNKVRKLEFLVAEAQTEGARTLITVGGIQSNHTRQTAALAARLGMDCIIVLSGEEPAAPSGNTFIDQLLGAEIVWCERPMRDQVLQETFQKAQLAGRKPYLMPLGGSTPTGTLGYVFAMEELVSQGIHADWVVAASSSAGTAGGMVLGANLFGFKGKILSISIDRQEQELKEKIAALASQAAGLLEEKATFHPEDILVNADYLGAGYAVLGEVEKEAILLFARQEGILLDPVYTGRAAAGMIDLIRKGFFKKGETVLFWHTGGTPALFAEQYLPIIQ